MVYEGLSPERSVRWRNGLTVALGLKLRDGAFVGHTSIKARPGTQGNRKHALDAELPLARMILPIGRPCQGRMSALRGKAKNIYSQ